MRQKDEMFRVLAVDDDPEIRDIYTRSLLQQREQGAGMALRQALRIAAPEPTTVDFDLALASQGEEALSIFETELKLGKGFDVVFLDMRMPPGWDGLRTAEAIRAIDEDVFIVFVSAYTDRTLDELRVRLGDNLMMIRKPFSRQDITQCAYALARQHRQRLELKQLKTRLDTIKQIVESYEKGEASADEIVAAVSRATLP